MWFSRPSGYSCVTRQSDTQLYGYSGNTRDTFIPNGFVWQKTSTSSFNTLPSGSVCLPDSPILPSSVLQPIILSAVIVVLCFFNVILRMFMGVRR